MKQVFDSAAEASAADKASPSAEASFAPKASSTAKPHLTAQAPQAAAPIAADIPETATAPATPREIITPIATGSAADDAKDAVPATLKCPKPAETPTSSGADTPAEADAPAETDANTPENEHYLKDAAPLTALLHLCLPMLAAMLVNVVANLVDAFFVGQLGDAAALAAIALAMPLVTVMMALGDLVGMGGSTLLSRLLGKQDRSKARRVSATNTYLALLFGAIMGIVCLVFLRPLCSLLGAHGNMLAPTMTYVGILALGAPLATASFAIDQNVRAEGAAGASARAAVISALANIALDALFIIGLGWGIAGAALATVLSWAVMTLYLLKTVITSPVQTLNPRAVLFTAPVLKEILGVGLSAFLTALILAVSSWMLDYLAAGYSTEVVAGIGIALRVQTITGLLAIVFGQGSIPLVAYAYAAGDARRVKALVKVTLALMFGSLGVATVILIVGAPSLVALFSSNTAVISTGVIALVALMLGTLLSAGSDLILGIMQALGRAVPATTLPIVRGAALVGLYLACNALFGMMGLLTANVVAEAIALGAALCFVPYLLRKVNAA